MLDDLVEVSVCAGPPREMGEPIPPRPRTNGPGGIDDPHGDLRMFGPTARRGIHHRERRDAAGVFLGDEVVDNLGEVLSFLPAPARVERTPLTERELGMLHAALAGLRRRKRELEAHGETP